MDTLHAEPIVRTAAPRLRADATRNRERIVTAARELFSEQGADAPLDDIAKRAGVGNATLYRNFPDRAALIRQVALSVMAAILDRAKLMLAEAEEPFEALCRFVHAAADERMGALCSLLSQHTELKQDEEMFAVKVELEQTIDQLMARAREAGRLRADVAPGDLFVGMAQLTRPLPGTGCVDLDGFVHRHLALFMDGLRAPAPSVLPGRPLTLDDLRAAP